MYLSSSNIDVKGVFKLLLLLSSRLVAPTARLVILHPLFNHLTNSVSTHRLVLGTFWLFNHRTFKGVVLQSCFLAPSPKSLGRPNLRLATEMSSQFSKSSSPVAANLLERQYVSSSSLLMATNTVMIALPALVFSCSSLIPSWSYLKMCYCRKALNRSKTSSLIGLSTYKNLFSSDSVTIFGSVISEVRAPGNWLVDAEEKPNYAADVGVSVLREA